jgi:Fe-S oxidoreductase
LAKQTYLLADFLRAHAPEWKPPSFTGSSIVLHGHCHHKAIFNMKAEHTLLEQTGAQVTMLDSGCCGMAGPFGFERDKYEVSQTLGERVLLPAVRSAGPNTIVVTDGFSCREQIAQNTSRHAVHLAQVLAQDVSAGTRQ